MRFIKFFAALVALLLLIYVSSSHGIGGSPLPAMGQLLCPFTGFWQNAEPAAPPPGEAVVRIEGRPVQGQVVYDERGVPHIFAETLAEASFLQGYVTARDRLWQMDAAVRAVSGRLAEVMGPNLLERDRLQRRRGFVEAARNSLAAWQTAPEEMALLEAYTEGINAYIASLSPAEYPLEFKLLGYAPEAWTPLKSALFFKNMAQTLCFRATDLPASRMLALLGRDTFNFLFPEDNPQQSPVIPPGTEWNFKPLAVDSLDTDLPLNLLTHRTEELPPVGIGSNNWALSGERTASGYPLLSNDPHLGLTLPSIWYEIQIQTPELNAYGVSLPGVPGIIIGFNEQVAWGVTNVGQDVLDWYRVDWADKAHRQYRLDGQVRDVRLIRDTIHVRGRSKPVVEEIPWTVWGPVVYDTADTPYAGLAMRWVAHDKPVQKPFYELGTFRRLMQARNYDDYREALKGYDAPAQNFIFAAHDGDIALTVNGRLPLRRPGQGRFVQDGSQSSAAWPGFIPSDQVPAVRNPGRGFVSSANQRSTDDTYPYYYLGGFDDYRGRYINRRLEQMQGATDQTVKQLQLDNYSLLPEEALPLMLAALGDYRPDGATAQMLADLRQWNYRFEPELKAPAVFDRWLDTIYTYTFDEFLQHEDRAHLLEVETWRLLDLLREAPDHRIFDDRGTPEREQAAQIVRRAFETVAADLAETYAADDFNWDTEKGTFIPHLGNIPAFASDRVYSGGHGDAPNALRRSTGPSWRMVVELTSPVRAWGVFPGGQSGNPGSPLYLTGVEPWGRGDYFELFFMENPEDRRQAVRKRVIFKRE